MAIPIHIVLIFHSRLSLTTSYGMGVKAFSVEQFSTIRKWSAIKTESFHVNRFI